MRERADWIASTRVRLPDTLPGTAKMLRQAASDAEQVETIRRACVCSEPDPVMQADGKFYCYACSYQTGARPRFLEPETWLRELNILRDQVKEQAREISATVKAKDARLAVLKEALRECHQEIQSLKDREIQVAQDQGLHDGE
jgi:hypothetical protein